MDLLGIRGSPIAKVRLPLTFKMPVISFLPGSGLKTGLVGDECDKNR